LADAGIAEASERNPALLTAINVMKGQVTHRAVAEAHGLPFVAPAF
jgi:alanine dehydrogenase